MHFLRPPAGAQKIGRGAALPPEDVGENVGVNHMQNVSCKGGIGDNSGQMPRGSSALLVGFSRQRFCDAV